MARGAVALSCTAEVMSDLERLSRSRSGEVRLAERARIVLACLRGKRNDEVARDQSARADFAAARSQHHAVTPGIAAHVATDDGARGRNRRPANYEQKNETKHCHSRDP